MQRQGKVQALSKSGHPEEDPREDTQQPFIFFWKKAVHFKLLQFFSTFFLECFPPILSLAHSHYADRSQNGNT